MEMRNSREVHLISFDSSFEALLQRSEHTFHLPDGLLKSLEGYTPPGVTWVLTLGIPP